MKTDAEINKHFNRLLEAYNLEVQQAHDAGLLTESTAKTYLLHASNFVKWCNGDFIPGDEIKPNNF